MAEKPHSWIGLELAGIASMACAFCAGCGGSHSGGGQAAPPVALGETQRGEATYYAATGAGNCSFPATPDDLMVAALNATQYGNAELCGACAEVEGERGSVVVRIVDQCPGCSAGDLDLSREAFARISEPERGRVPITWKLVACPVEGPLLFHFKEGSNPWWMALQVRNHRLPVGGLEVWREGAWVAVERKPYNYFVVSEGMGNGGFRVRVRASGGTAVEQELPPTLSGALHRGSVQF